MSGNVSNHIWVEDATKPLGGYWVREKGTADGATLVSDLGFVNAKHDRRVDSVTATWPGNDTFACTFTQVENVRRYRWHFVTNSGTVTHVKVAEDAVNEAQAEVWLADPTALATADAMNRRLYTEKVWSEWIELSKDSDDLSLSRLDFLAAGLLQMLIFSWRPNNEHPDT